jgi:hypothetical protein
MTAALLLVDAGARPDAANGKGKKVYAAGAGQLETVLALVSAWW